MKQDSPSRHRCLSFLHILVLVAYSVVNVLYSYISYNRIKEGANDAVDITDNWQSRPISEISVAETCPTGYEPVFNYTWPGTNAGCLCSGVNSFYKSSYKIDCDECVGKCSLNQTRAGCVDITPFSPYPIDSLGKYNGKQSRICVLRTNETWLDAAPDSGIECEDPDAIRCGITRENIFCTKEKKCPINDIKIITLANASSLVSCLYDTGCIVLSTQGTSARVLQFKRGSSYDSLPITQFKLNEFGMCRDIDENNVTPNRKEFYLLRKKRTSCGSEGDALWNLTDSYTEKDLFTINGLQPVIDNLTNYGYYETSKTGSDYRWGFYTRSYIPWTIECRDQMERLVGRSHSAGSLKFTQLVQLIVNAIIGVILGIFIPVFNCTGANQRFATSFNWLGKIIQAPFQVLAALVAANVGSFYAGLVEDQCSTDAVLAVIGDVSVDSRNAYSDNIKGIIALGLAVLFDIISWCYLRSQAGQESYQQQVNIEQQPYRGGVKVNVH